MTAAKHFCPHCEEVHPCPVVPASDLGEKSGNRYYRTDHPDIQYFRRWHNCENCFEYFETYELDATFVRELTKLREALQDIKANAAEYDADAKKAAKTLNKLSKSLKVLKALE
jgi:hypothetical protein